jgi:glucosamine kinase
LRYFLGLDAGGSTCRARVIDDQGQLVGQAKGGPANARIGIEALIAVLSQTIKTALGAIAPSDVSAALGIAGLKRPGIEAALSANPFGFGALKVASDAHVACLGAHQGGDGAIVIVGTGSIGLMLEDGLETKVGGHGFPISGEGSGAFIGLQALIWLYRVSDLRAHYEPLYDALLSPIGGTIEASYLWVDKAGPTDYATLAPLVLAAATKGEAAALDFMTHAGLAIGELVEAVFARGATRCSLIGGLSEAILPYLPGHIATRLTPPLGDPIDGALLLARG